MILLLLKPGPTSAVQDTVDGTHTNRIFCSQDRNTHSLAPLSSDFSNKFFGQFVHAVPFTPIVWRTSAPFIPRISLILRAGSEEQMIRANTPRIVAFVTDEETSRNWTKMNLPGSSMCSDISLLEIIFEPSVSVAVRIPALPQPAIDSLVNTRPEPLFKGNSLFRDRPITCLAAVFTTRMIGGYELALAS